MIARIAWCVLCVASASVGARSGAAQDVHGTVSGTVFDSIAGRAIVGAQVQLVSTSQSSWERSAITDAKGRFRFDCVAVGSYLLGFYDVALDSLGLEAPLRKFDVYNANEVRVALAIPSSASIIRFNCKGQPDSTGLFVGVDSWNWTCRPTDS